VIPVDADAAESSQDQTEPLDSDVLGSSDTDAALRVSVVVLNWNSGDLGVRAVRSALDQAWVDIEVIVVDNASSDDSLGAIESAFGDRIIVVRNQTNLGFGPGMNVGIAKSTGEYVLALNCDAELDSDYVATLVRTLSSDPRVAAAGGRVRSERVGTSGPLAITQTMRTRNLADSTATECDKVNGACPLFRRAALDQVVEMYGGPYDPTYSMYGEDIDLALTLARLGWIYRYEPSAGASHVRSFASAPRLVDRRGPLRVSTLLNRHRNIVRHARHWVLTDLLAILQDIGFAVLAATKRDLGGAGDVVVAWSQHTRTVRGDLRRRRELPPWPRF
jgi:GT2 family glycosyltransferase